MRKQVKQLTKIVAAGVLGASLLLAGCSKGANEGPPTSQKPLVIRVGSTLAGTHPVTVALSNTFKTMVEQESGGALKVEVYEGGMLGGEKELYDSVRNGNLQIAAVGTLMWNEVGKMSIPDWPFLFRDLDHARTVYMGDVGKEMAADVEKIAKVHFIGWFPNGARVFSSNRTINTLDDFKGLRIRMPNNPIHIQVGSLLGANVTPMPMGEVFTALEQKVVDGQDNPLSTIRNEGWYEVQSDVFISNHMISTIELLASEKMWKVLSPEQIAIIEKAALKSSQVAWDDYAKSIEADKEFLQQKGLKVTEPDQQTRQQLVELMKPVYEKLYDKYDWAKAMEQRIRSIQN